MHFLCLARVLSLCVFQGAFAHHLVPWHRNPSRELILLLPLSPTLSIWLNRVPTIWADITST